MYLSNDQSKLFCLECVDQINTETESSVFPMLEQLVKNHALVNVYKDVDTIEDFETALNTLLYEDRNFKDYNLLYFICKGNGNEIIVGDYYYSLNEIAELFEGKLQNKIIHFSNSKTLDLDEDMAQYFLDITGAKAISGYQHTSFINSFLLDYHFFGLQLEIDDTRELVETLFDKHYALCTQLGFHLYY